MRLHSITASYDKSSYPSFDPIQDRTQSACQAAVAALGNVCTTEAGKTAVRAIKTSSCQFSNTGTGVDYQSNTLTIRIDPSNTAITGKEKGSYSWVSALKELL